MVDMDLKKSLQQLGFTDYEADAYLYLNKNGVSEANPIYKETKIPYGRIYDVLNSLSAKGFIEIQNSRPKQYMVKSPKISFNQLLKTEKTRLIDEFERKKDLCLKLEKQLNQTKPETKDKNIFWTTSVGTKSIIKTIESIFLEVEKEVNIIPHPFLKSETPLLINRVNDIVRNDVKIKLLTSKNFIPIKLVKDRSLVQEVMPHLQIRTVESIDSYFVIIDVEKVVILQTNPLKKDEILALLKIWDPDMAQDFKSKFDELWEKAEPVHLKD